MFHIPLILSGSPAPVFGCPHTSAIQDARAPSKFLPYLNLCSIAQTSAWGCFVFFFLKRTFYTPGVCGVGGVVHLLILWVGECNLLLFWFVETRFHSLAQGETH